MEASEATYPPDEVTFEHPPVHEVAMGVQFSSPALDEVAVLAEFWPRVREDFPRLEKQAPVAPASETFEGDASAPPGVEVHFGPQAPPVRYWFLTTAGTDLVQVQQDRFIVNWRQVEHTDMYPRYRHLRARFEREYASLTESLGPELGGNTAVDLCEITYVNQIPGELDGVKTQLADVLSILQPRSAGSSVLPEIEDSNFQARYVVNRQDGDDSIGRLYVSAGPATRAPTGKQIYALSLLVRGRPEGQRIEDFLDFFDRGRSLIVQGFRELTTERMHELWGLRDG